MGRPAPIQSGSLIYLRRENKAGTPREGFLLHTLKILFRLSRVLLDLQKCILSGAIKFVSVRSSWGNLSLFEITRAFNQYYYPENFRCNLRYHESENFADSSLHHIFESENFSFLFSTKNSLTWGVKCENIKLTKIVGNLLDELRKLYMNRTVIQKFLAVNRKSQAIFAYPNRYFIENSQWVPLIKISLSGGASQ